MTLQRRWLALAALAGAGGCAEVARFDPQGPSDRLGVWIPGASATILHTGQSRFDNPTQVVISDTPAWIALWTQAWGGAQAAPSLPAFDFVLSSVLVLGLGRRLGLGYEVAIDSVVVATTGAVLYATETLPGAQCDTSTGTSSPAHLVHFPGHPPITDWRIGRALGGCGSSTALP